jgi:hypothetical protein
MSAEEEDSSSSPFRPRPSWWVEASARDTDDTARDDAADERDRVAVTRDAVARERDEAALERERDGVESVIAALEHGDAAADSAVEPLLEAERLRRDEQTIENARLDVAAERPELAAALALAQRHIDEVYAVLLASAVSRDQARSDLRRIAQHLAAASTARQAAEQDRDHARSDREAAHMDRDNSRTGRQQSAIDRAPRRGDDA